MEQTYTDSITTYTFPVSGTYHVYQDNSDAAYGIIEAKAGDILKLDDNVSVVLVTRYD